jgi:type IV pilus assembly protein PilC
MVQSAELTGNLDEILERLASYLERDTDARDKVKAALTYPGVVLTMSFGVTILLITFVLPKFEPFFASFHTQLPWSARFLLGINKFVQGFWWAIAAAAVALAVGVAAFVMSARTRPLWDRYKLRVPVLGEVLRFAVVERFCRVLGAMLRAGVPVPEALRIASEASNNRFIVARLDSARSQMMQGGGIAAPLALTGVFPMAAIQMLRVGESTGSLDSQLEQAAAYFERELGYKIKRMTTLIEPLVIIIMGLVVGFVALTLVSTMYGVFRGGGIGGGG